MSTALRKLTMPLRKFGHDLRGSLSVETVLIFPLLMWAFVAMFVYFDAYRAKSTNLKAAYTMGDMLSRETNPIDTAYLDGLNLVFDFITNTDQETWMRVTVVTFNADTQSFEVKWSKATKGRTAYTTTTFKQVENQIPAMPAGDTVIVVETSMDYVPAFNVGLNNMSFDNLVVTRPRFAPQLLWQS